MSRSLPRTGSSDDHDVDTTATAEDLDRIVADSRESSLRGRMESVQADPAVEHTVSGMADQAGVSVRHLTRLSCTETGTTPSNWRERVRVDAARTLILQGHTVTRVAQRSGFGSDETLRRAFARQPGTTPRVFRERFAATAPPARRALD